MKNLTLYKYLKVIYEISYQSMPYCAHLSKHLFVLYVAFKYLNKKLSYLSTTFMAIYIVNFFMINVLLSKKLYRI